MATFEERNAIYQAESEAMLIVENRERAERESKLLEQLRAQNKKILEKGPRQPSKQYQAEQARYAKQLEAFQADERRRAAVPTTPEQIEAARRAQWDALAVEEAKRRSRWDQEDRNQCDVDDLI